MGFPPPGNTGGWTISRVMPGVWFSRSTVFRIRVAPRAEKGARSMPGTRSIGFKFHA